MWVKALGAAVVLAGCTLIGVLRARRYQQRVQVLADMQRTLRQVRMQVWLQGAPLYMVLEPIARDVCAPVAHFLTSVCFQLSGNAQSLRQVWHNNVQASFVRHNSALGLEKEDIALIDQIGTYLGGGRDAQSEALELLEHALSKRVEQAQQARVRSAHLSIRIAALIGAMLALAIL
nr:stage III sporulation protein AB [Maliibacterium massiliense]